MSKNGSIVHRAGFTLVELMLAVVLSSIVMAAIGGLLVGYWRIAQDFNNTEQTMAEISMVSKLFRKHARTVGGVAGADRITFTDGSTNYVLSLGAFEGIVYDNNGHLSTLLENNDVLDMNPVITNGTLIQLKLDLKETEYGKINTYDMYVMPRNE